MVAFINLTGQRFGRLIVLETFKTKNSRTLWECRCDCGNTGFYISSNLKRGVTKSCGCYLRDRVQETSVKHRMCGTKPYRAWYHLRARCDDPSDKSFHNYGGRGITYCDRWKDFANFYADMGDPPSPQHSIDRYPNNDGNYEPGNCRWATRQEQSDNCRHTIWLDTQWGRITVRQASAMSGIAVETIKGRWRRGISGDALFSASKGLG